MKRKKAILSADIFIILISGAFAARSLYILWDYRTHPLTYAVRSAPWYTDILLWGVIALAAVAAALTVRHFLIRRNK